MPRKKAVSQNLSENGTPSARNPQRSCKSIYRRADVSWPCSRNDNRIQGETQLKNVKTAKSSTFDETNNVQKIDNVSMDKKDRANKSKSDLESEVSDKIVKRKQLFKALVCPYCIFKYRCPKELGPHVKATHPSQLNTKAGPDTPTKYKCLYCNESSSRPRNVVSHMQIFHSENFTTDELKHHQKFLCASDGCKQGFRRQSDFRKHMSVAHGETDQVSRSRRYDIDKLRERANRVGKYNTSTVCTLNHKSSRLNDCNEECWQKACKNKGFSCFHCNKTFTHHCLCVMHELRHEVKGRRHPDQTSIVKYKETSTNQCQNIDIEKYDTSYVGGESSDHYPKGDSAENQKTSIENHDNNLDKSDNHSCHKAAFNKEPSNKTVLGNVCPICKKSFTTVRYAKLHMNVVHKKLARFVCTECGNKYLHLKGLTSHQANHHSTKQEVQKDLLPSRKYTCKDCGACLATYSGMKTHMNKHNGIRPYKCSYCDRTFTSMNHLTAHESIHTGHKAHRCPICYKTFTNQGTLYNHLYRYAVHGKLPRVRQYGNEKLSEKLPNVATEQLEKLANVNIHENTTQNGSNLIGSPISISISNDEHTVSLPCPLIQSRGEVLTHNSEESAQNRKVNDAVEVISLVNSELVESHKLHTNTIDFSQSQLDKLQVMTIPDQSEEYVGVSDMMDNSSDVEPNNAQQTAVLIMQQEVVKDSDGISSEHELNVQYIQIIMSQEENIVKYLLSDEITPA